MELNIFVSIFSLLNLLETADHEGDFHWYRLDRDRKWSHKQGEARVSRVDNAGREIDDPRRASMANYQFVCFMTSNRFTVQIEDDEECEYWE